MADSMKRARKNFNAQMKRRIDALVREQKGTVSEKAMQEAVQVFAMEVDELTPRDTGSLQSARKDEVIVKDGKIIGRVYFDGSTASSRPEHGTVGEYMLFVHQVPPKVHDKANNPPRAQWRFLSTALQNKRQEILKILNKSRGRLKAAFEGKMR